jgi:hypothetical protein
VTERRPVVERRPTIRAASVVAAMIAGLVVGGCSSHDSSAPTLADVTALLTRRAAAVRDHDRAAFLAGVSTGAGSAAFRRAQARQFANLVRLPLATWTYRVESRTDDHAAEAAADKRYGAAAIVVRLALRYALRGVDPIPTTHDLWWTFIRSDGRVVLAGDDALADVGGVSWRGPWDFGPLDVVPAARGIVLGHLADDIALHAIAGLVDSAVPTVSAVWGTGWPRDVAVIVPASQNEFDVDTGESADVTSDAAAVAVADGQDPRSGRVYGQRLVVNPSEFARLSTLGRRITIRHEITHIATADATGAASPRWLVEGFAEYVGNLGTGQPVPTAASELRAQVRHGALPTALPSDAAFDTAGSSAPAYEQAWLACRLIAARAGQRGLVRFYRLVGASPSASGVAVAAALRSVLHETTAAFIGQWRASLKAQLS